MKKTEAKKKFDRYLRIKWHWLKKGLPVETERVERLRLAFGITLSFPSINMLIKRKDECAEHYWGYINYKDYKTLTITSP